jgi:hypothetical protein
MILPWVNEFHPANINAIPIPREIPELMIINDLEIEVGDDFFSFTMDP